jgi:hypothetical protein
MKLRLNREDYRQYREMLDDKLTELALYAKELCPEAVVEVSKVQYEDEDGAIYIFPGDIFEETGLFILCAALDPTAK